jgi:acyl dehydratase
MPLYFEDIAVGFTYTTPKPSVFETDIVNFVALSGMYDDLSCNLEYIEHESVFKDRFAPGALTWALAQGLTTRTGSQPSGKGPLENFTGTVRTDPLFQPPAPARARRQCHIRARRADCVAHSPAGSDPHRDSGLWPGAELGWPDRENSTG